MDKNRRTMGFAIATTAAALFVGGFATPATSHDNVTVKCYSANECKGKGQCKTAKNECRGKNSCKGQGFDMMTEMACIEKLGRA